METDTRLYQPIQVDLIGIEKGLERFTTDGITKLPPVALWRNNLTALSHTRNLYFVATSVFVAVYEPEFPYQTLKRSPVLVILPDVTHREATGAIANSPAHAVNQLMVGQLGSQEILLLARDSGNVEAYNIAAISQAIKRIPDSYEGERTSLIFNVRPFFKQWVKQSAWGLAIHKEARMIAVSANVPSPWQPADSEDSSATITVFAFALSPHTQFSDPGSDSSSLYVDEDDWIPWSGDDGPLPRDQNRRIVLAGRLGHENNIPNIAFVNTPQDRHGAWILSTDILGRMKMWHIWSRTCWRTWDFGHDIRRVWMGAPSYPGWQVAALDVNDFRRATTTEEFIGATRAPIHHGNFGGGASFDLSSIARRVPGRSQYHPAHPDAELDPSIEDDLDETLDEGEDSTTSKLLIQHQECLEDDAPSSAENSNFDRQVYYELEEDTQYVVTSSDEDEFTSSDGERQMPSPPPERSLRTSRLLDQMVTPINDKTTTAPEIAILHCGNKSIRLLGGPKAKYPHIFCAGILRQVFPDTHVGRIHSFTDRLNMLHKIPELGVVIIATQAGRIAVCALTRRDDGLLGMRIDWILPTKREELRGQRPELCPLIGVAVAPIQGYYDDLDPSEQGDGTWADDSVLDGVKTSFEHKVVLLQGGSNREVNRSSGQHKRRRRIETERRKVNLDEREWKLPKDADPGAAEKGGRWRVMLTYSDLSVLTYEISRPEETKDKLGSVSK